MSDETFLPLKTICPDEQNQLCQFFSLGCSEMIGNTSQSMGLTNQNVSRSNENLNTYIHSEDCTTRTGK